MDVQMENTDPPPCESQPSGKIRKGFKLFGKRKPGNIFSIRNKGDENHKSPVPSSKTLDGLTDSEQEPGKERDHEVSQGENGQAEEETLGEDGVLAAAPPRHSISSATSAKSLSFLSLLKGSRRGGGARQVQTVSQPVGRQRRGLKGLFGSVKFHPKDKEGKEEAPPSPLLMSSRTNSVEIIKEDLTLTPKSQTRSLDSPETESYEPGMSLTQDSSTTSPSETMAPQMTAENVSRTNEHVLPLPVAEPPMVPGESSLSCLLADISSLLTFDSITAGGDIIADVEAEWGKACSAISTVAIEVEKPPSMSVSSKPAFSSSPTSASSVSTAPVAKSSPLATKATAPTQSFTPTTKTTTTASPITPPSSIIATSAKSSTLTTHSFKSGSDFTPAAESATFITIKSTPTAATKPMVTPVTLTSFSTPRTSSPSTTTKSTPCATAAVTTAPLNPPAAVVKTPLVSPIPTSTVQKLAPEITAPTQIIAPVSKASSVAIPPPASAKTTTVTHSPPVPVASSPSPPAKLDSTNSFNLQSSPSSHKPSQSSVAGEAKAPVTCALTAQLSFPAPVVSSNMPAITASAPAPASVSVTLPKPTHTSSPVNLNAIPPSLATVPDLIPSLTWTAMSATKTQPIPASAPTPTTSDKLSPATTPTPAPASLNKMPPTPTPASTSQTVASTQSPTTPSPSQMTPPNICPIISPPSTPAPLQSEAPTSAKMKISGQASVDGQMTSLCSADSPETQIISSKTEQVQNESRTTVQVPTRESRIPQVKASGLSKIPVVGGGRGGKLPVRDNQHIDEETSGDPPTPVLEEERIPFSLQERGSKDKISDVEANVPISKHTQEESQQHQQPKVIPSLPRDSKIPVKQGAPSHTGSQIPQAKDPPRTKIPVSKVPVRRVGNKPAAVGGGAQIRK